jgi:23S rRNA pseudouridine1911/1915/1917 synthase
MTEEYNIGDLVVYKNNQLIAFNKPTGLAVQEDKTADKALINLGEIYCHSRLFPIHRIDRPASGAVLFAKNKNAAAHLSEQFKSAKIKKTYLAVVAKKPESETGELAHYLRKDGRNNKSIVSKEADNNTKLARLRYDYLESIDNYHLLSIELLTGRHHQIRAQLAAIGCPIKGDVKYGARRKNHDRSIHLHAWKLGFAHPITNDQEEVVALPNMKDSVWRAFKTLSDGTH